METLTKDQLIDKIIWSQFKGMKMDQIFYNDRYNALSKLSIEELKKLS